VPICGEPSSPRGLGPACISVSLDEAADKANALKFLEPKGAKFANYLLDEPFESAQERWNFTGIPVVVVYSRDGRIARTFTMDNPNKQFTYADVESFVKELIDQ
jgi:hypothetical protein